MDFPTFTRFGTGFLSSLMSNVFSFIHESFPIGQAENWAEKASKQKKPGPGRPGQGGKDG